MKLSRKQVMCKSRALPKLEFSDQKLSSFSGLLLFQVLFSNLRLRERCRQCLRHLADQADYPPVAIFLGLIVHILLGYRKLRDVAFYKDDPMVLRILGLKRLPDVGTVSRLLAKLDTRAVEKLRAVLRDLVLQRLALLAVRRITLDFDGSVMGTTRKAEGTAVGFNKKKKGQRSYYPLFCTIAQTGQVLDFHHRPGNVHDSNGARQFILACIREIRKALPGVAIEARMDSAFFSDAIVALLHEEGVEFTISVPFERLFELKQRIEMRKHWRRLNDDISWFELSWKPKVWKRRYRFLAIRTRTAKQRSGPLQLDLFIPQVHGFTFKVIVTNKTISPRHVTAYHEGRGSQEGIFAELKSEGQMDYIPVRSCNGNQAFLLAVIMAHNLNRETQMQIRATERRTTEKRAPLWKFERLATTRQRFIQRAGRLTRPQGILTLTLSANRAVKHEFLNRFESLRRVA